jgi:hypothetical protein
MEQLGDQCRGLELEMLEDLLAPDDVPEGQSYASGHIRLASSFSVEARRLEEKVERGRPQGAGLLIFRPVELLAGDRWLLTCWHPTQTFNGTEKIDFEADVSPTCAADVLPSVAKCWESFSCQTSGDLGVLIMRELAMGYGAANWALARWFQDWELSLYLDDEIDNPEELKRLWGEMAVLRDWLTALNLPGLRKDLDKAWLPVSQHKPVIEVDDQVDKALERLGELGDKMRSAFSILHLQQAEQERDRREETQYRIELFAAIFLIPTLIVGFYGANTWIPGQGRHWGFWAMVVVLLIFSATTGLLVRHWHNVRRAARKVQTAEQSRGHMELLERTTDRTAAE